MKEKTQMLSYQEAMGSAIIEEMRKDKKVVMWGEDITRFRIFAGMPGAIEAFGRDRVRNTPIVEIAIVEMTIGAALTGLKPIAFLSSTGFFPLCLDGIFLKLGNYYQLHNYKGPLPVVIHATIGGPGATADHALSAEALLVHSPGLKVVAPASPYDAKGLMKAAIRDNRPVIYLSSSVLGTMKEEVPTEDYIVPLGKAAVKKQGKDVTLVTYAAMVAKALTAAEALGKQGISVEVVDLRSLVPMDVETIVKSVKKTGRLLIAHTGMKRGGFAGEIAFRVTEAAPEVVKSLKTPIKRLAAKNIALPHGAELEKYVVPQVEDIVKTVKEMV
ncbi:MAG: transketolase C-terminal domain-containing protein [Chloroflexota bacterium]